jgi:hypothetical protein
VRKEGCSFSWLALHSLCLSGCSLVSRKLIRVEACLAPWDLVINIFLTNNRLATPKAGANASPHYSLATSALTPTLTPLSPYGASARAIVSSLTSSLLSIASLPPPLAPLSPLSRLAVAPNAGGSGR